MSPLENFCALVFIVCLLALMVVAVAVFPWTVLVVVLGMWQEATR